MTNDVVYKRTKNAGFTLIELAMMIVLIGILVVGFLVTFNPNKVDLDATAKVLKSNIQFAQDLAMTHGSVYGFRKIDSVSYEIFEGVAGVPAKDPLTNGFLVVNISPIQFQGATPTVQFQSSGRPAIVADAQIVITDGTSIKTLTIKNNTGFITLQ